MSTAVRNVTDSVALRKDQFVDRLLGCVAVISLK
jgi:hypothetical protein